MESGFSGRRPRPMSFLAAAGWTLVVVLLYSYALAVCESARSGAIGDVVTRTAAGALAYSLVLFAILRVHEPEESIRRVLALRAPRLVTLPLAIVAGAGLAAPSAWLDKVLLARLPYSEQEAEALERVYGATTLDTSGKRLALVVTMVVLMPLCDELFFHGALFTPLQKGRRLGAVILATAAYETLVTAPHPRDLAPFLVLALVLSSVRGLTGSVWPSMLARIAFYAPRFVPMALGRELPGLSKGWLAGSVLASIAALAGIAAFGRRSVDVIDVDAEDG